MWMGRIAIGLECGYQSAQSRCKENQIASISVCGVSVGYASRHKYSSADTSVFDSIAIPKSEIAFQDVPSFVIGMMDVERGRAASSPLMNLKRFPNGGERSRFHCAHSTRPGGGVVRLMYR